ncbi:Uncharacterized protein dnm_020500 [Desulfonema magnum]|uniref:Uncharacterized protein n=1 Tax=Desulfonema magnum TaxID=45655 RepID=A0A975BIA9_9BACT|nr:Uncharacterized protein dnm_020500 [Desulfonema magnum]
MPCLLPTRSPGTHNDLFSISQSAAFLRLPSFLSAISEISLTLTGREAEYFGRSCKARPAKFFLEIRDIRYCLM